MRERVFFCLNCEACTVNCPSGVAITDIILAARAQLLRDLGQPAVERLVLRELLAEPSRMALGGSALALYERTGLRWLAHKSRLLDLLPVGLADKESLLPHPNTVAPARRLLPDVASPGTVKRRVAYFLGCVTDVAFQNTARAVVDVLRANDCQVLIARDLRCCGMPHHNYGDSAKAQELEKHNTEVLNQLDVDAIVVDCATCGSTLKAYSGLSATVFDINEFLVDKIDLRQPQYAVDLRVTYHDPCHLARGQGIREAPRQVMAAVPGVETAEMAESDRCCGGAGTFALLHHEASMQILDRKMANAAATEAEVIATSCPACRMQLSHGLGRLQASTLRRVVHPVEILAGAYAGKHKKVTSWTG